MKNSTHNIILGLLCAATAAIPVGLILAAPVMRAQPAAAAAPAPKPIRLIGFGCQPGSKTLLAAEEDEFPGKCAEIDTIEAACAVSWEENGETYSTILQPQECVDYWGDGY